MYDTVELWENIETYYDNNVNKANVIFYQIEILPLEINTSVKATSFISDFKD